MWCAVAHAQNPQLSPADAKWNDLQQRLQTRPAAADANPAAQRRAQTERFARLAAAAAEFAKHHPNHPKNAEAKYLEAKSRLGMALLADTPPEGTNTLADAVRRDAALPAAQRYEVAWMAEAAALRARRPSGREAWLAEKEKVARALAAEFPGVPGAEGGLLEIAAFSDAKNAARLAREVLNVSQDLQVRRQAEAIHARAVLEGNRLETAIADTPGGLAAVAPASQKLLVIYTWDPGLPGSIAMAQEIGRRAPKGAFILSVNIGRPLSGAPTVPGTQLYGGAGRDSPFAKRLALTQPGLVYVVGEDGIVQTTRGERNLAAALSTGGK